MPPLSGAKFSSRVLPLAIESIIPRPAADRIDRNQYTNTPAPLKADHQRCGGTMRRFSLTLAFIGLALACAMAAPTASKAESGKASRLVFNMGDSILTLFNAQALTLPEKEVQMYRIAIADFDVPACAKFVLGRYWNVASPEQRNEFTAVFGRYVAHVYADTFDIYHDVAFKVLDEHTDSNARTIVNSEIVRRNGRPPIKVVWNLRPSGSAFRIFDVKVDDVSALIALRDEFGQVLASNHGDIAALIQTLRDKTKEAYTATPQ
jgi:phospholipid transport system substrate-binding protein